jgi:hypothetical protein
MSEGAPSVVATTGRGVAPALALACLLLASCGQKGVLMATHAAPAPPSASSPDTLPIPGVSPADLPAPVPQP